MSLPIPTTEPITVNAGDTVQWQRTLAQYPAGTGWALSYVLINATHRISITASASGDAHVINVPAATTAAWVPGTYTWRAQVSRGPDVFTVGEGRIVVRHNFAAATLEARSRTRQALDAVEAFLADPQNIVASKYTIAGRSLDRVPLTELWAHGDRLRLAVMREDQARGIASDLPDQRRVYVRFVPPGR